MDISRMILNNVFHAPMNVKHVVLIKSVGLAAMDLLDKDLVVWTHVHIAH